MAKIRWHCGIKLFVKFKSHSNSSAASSSHSFKFSFAFSRSTLDVFVSSGGITCAMSEEALDRVIKKYIEEYKVEDSPENLRQDLKWSYADSPYNLYGEQYFTKVQ